MEKILENEEKFPNLIVYKSNIINDMIKVEKVNMWY